MTIEAKGISMLEQQFDITTIVAPPVHEGRFSLRPIEPHIAESLRQPAILHFGPDLFLQPRQDSAPVEPRQDGYTPANFKSYDRLVGQIETSLLKVGSRQVQQAERPVFEYIDRCYSTSTKLGRPVDVDSSRASRLNAVIATMRSKFDLRTLKPAAFTIYGKKVDLSVPGLEERQTDSFGTNPMNRLRMYAVKEAACRRIIDSSQADTSLKRQAERQAKIIRTTAQREMNAMAETHERHENELQRYHDTIESYRLVRMPTARGVIYGAAAAGTAVVVAPYVAEVVHDIYEGIAHPPRANASTIISEDLSSIYEDFGIDIDEIHTEYLRQGNQQFPLLVLRIDNLGDISGAHLSEVINENSDFAAYRAFNVEMTRGIAQYYGLNAYEMEVEYSTFTDENGTDLTAIFYHKDEQTGKRDMAFLFDAIQGKIVSIDMSVLADGETISIVAFQDGNLQRFAPVFMSGNSVIGALPESITFDDTELTLDKLISFDKSTQFLESSFVAEQVAVKGIVNATKANIRSGPGTNFEDIGDVLHDKSVSVIGIENGWYKIMVDGKVAFISSELVDIASENTIPLPTPEPVMAVDQLASNIVLSPSDLSMPTGGGESVAAPVESVEAFMESYQYQRGDQIRLIRVGSIGDNQKDFQWQVTTVDRRVSPLLPIAGFKPSYGDNPMGIYYESEYPQPGTDHNTIGYKISAVYVGAAIEHREIPASDAYGNELPGINESFDSLEIDVAVKNKNGEDVILRFIRPVDWYMGYTSQIGNGDNEVAKEVFKKIATAFPGVEIHITAQSETALDYIEYQQANNYPHMTIDDFSNDPSWRIILSLLNQNSLTSFGALKGWMSTGSTEGLVRDPDGAIIMFLDGGIEFNPYLNPVLLQQTSS